MFLSTTRSAIDESVGNADDDSSSVSLAAICSRSGRGRFGFAFGLLESDIKSGRDCVLTTDAALDEVAVYVRLGSASREGSSSMM